MAQLVVSRTEMTTPTAIANGAVSASGGGDYFIPGSNSPIFIYVANGHSSSQSVVFDDPNSRTPEGATQFNPDVTISVPNADNRLIPLRNPSRFVDPATGRINLSYSGVTSLTIKVFS